MRPQQCPALLISAPASGQGKTTVTAALAWYHRQQGRRVRVFKTGPDFLDPLILEHASGNPVYQLDLWMGGEQHCHELLYQASCDADIILIEGVMGLFDGQTSSADLARLFNIPVLAVINATAMAQTFGAIAYGLANYKKDLPFAGVIANQVASTGHAELLAESLPDDIRLFGAIQRDTRFSLPGRHLGLVQAEEINDLEQRLAAAADTLTAANLDLMPEPVKFKVITTSTRKEKPLQGVRIAVAHDVAFAFVYRANIKLLQQLGAETLMFSPLKDTALPEADCLYLPGGYPELHLDALQANSQLVASIHQHHADNKPIVAECGGMLYLLESLTDKQGQRANMAGILPGHATMQDKLANLGMHVAPLPEGNLRGHTFHHSMMETTLAPIAMSEAVRKRNRAEPIYRQGRLHASYMHLYFPSNPKATAELFTP